MVGQGKNTPHSYSHVNMGKYFKIKIYILEKTWDGDPTTLPNYSYYVIITSQPVNSPSRQTVLIGKRSGPANGPVKVPSRQTDTLNIRIFYAFKNNLEGNFNTITKVPIQITGRNLFLRQ